MRFEVPQFIDVEDKIFGPLTLKQFIYLIGGGALAYLSYKIVPFPFNLILVVAFAGFALALAFYRLNNRPFLEVVQSYVKYKIASKIYIWQRAPATKKSDAPVVAPVPVAPAKDTSEKRISTLAQNLDILDQ